MNFVQSIGSARRSQGIFTFGIGTIVDFKMGSFMPLGLQFMDQQWYGLPREAKESATFYEPRLQKLLGVKEFRSLPTPGEGQMGDYGDRVEKAWTVPCVRFPVWLECPSCHRLGKVNDPFEPQPNGKVLCLNANCRSEVNPVRFITSCLKGHIDDFPWVRWAHRSVTSSCDNPSIYLKSKGKSAALGDLYVKCKCSAPPESLTGIFNSGELKKIGLRCRGNRPWLLSWEQCGGDIRTLQRGGSNVHFPVVASMLSIPPASESMAKIIEPFWNLISAIPDSALEFSLGGLLQNLGVTVDTSMALDWVLRRKGIDIDNSADNEQSARYQEFQSLTEECLPVATGTHRPEFENAPFEPSEDIRSWIDLVSAVHRLREVRVLCGFTRIEPWALNIEDIPDSIQKKAIAPLSTGYENWRPAVEVRGEGLFLKINEKRLSIWETNPRVIERANRINKIFVDRCVRDGIELPYKITPRHLLIHSFAHVLIRRMSLDCGYSSASLRERLYISDGNDITPPMAGILIYTASPDSDGSLGGIIGLATPDRVSNIINRTIQDAQWCGNDPVCIETESKTGGERLSAAACHNCLLVPETACEKFNRELDRGMIVGFPESESEELVPGFFSDFSIET